MKTILTSILENNTTSTNLSYHLNEEILVENQFEENARAFVQLDSSDIWLKCVITMKSLDFRNFESTFDIKVDKSLNGKELKQVM